MDDNRDKRTDNSSDDAGMDGEYHFVRPEQRLYEDAEFVPQDEATEVPHYYAPEEKKPHERSGEAQRSGNLEFDAALTQQRAALQAMHCPEADWFLEHCLPCYAQNLDELTRP